VTLDTPMVAEVAWHIRETGVQVREMRRTVEGRQ
jgi:hypothetical protein